MLLLPLVWIGLRVTDFSRMRRWAEAMPSAVPDPHLPVAPGHDVTDVAQRYAALTAIAARHGLYPANCLHQSLALCRLLSRERIPGQLKIGVRTKEAALDAHAWVEVRGVVLGLPVSGYAVFDNLDVPPTLTR